jgi:uncharacterized RDD family membrane protein YckC
MADLVTGEAVVLELRLAKLPSRAIAIFIDLFVQVSMLYGVTFLAGTAAPANDGALVAAVALVGSIAVLVGYPVLFESLSRGKSLGKLVLGLRVVQEDGGPVRFRQSLIRALAGVFVDFWSTFGAGAILSSLLSAKGKRVGDILAGTVVVLERVPVRRTAAPSVPPALAAWARSLDVARLPDPLAIEARQYLSRQRELAPDVADGVGRRIATEMSRYVSPPAPPGTPAPAYIAAVLAERRERDLRRYAASASTTGPTTPQQPVATPPVQVQPARSGDGFAPPA